jgi:RimJ/RimL family protein N-acetyltransferase
VASNKVARWNGFELEETIRNDDGQLVDLGYYGRVF